VSPLVQWIVIGWLGCAAAVVLWMIAQRERSGRRRGLAPPARDAWRPAPIADAEWKFSLDPRRGIEETRLMPGAEDRDTVPEGLGCVRPPKVLRAWPSVATPLELLPKAERELWREALKAGL